MATRRAAWLIITAALLAPRAEAFESRGGPIRSKLTLDGRLIDVDVTWVQSGGVVILKIVSAKTVKEDERERLLAAAKTRLKDRPGLRAAYTQYGQLMLGFRLTGWKTRFTANDLVKGAGQ
jgi:hypothetical protein